MFGPLFEDLRGPPKYMLSQFTEGSSSKPIEQIIASDDETEDAEAPFIQKLFGILRIYYTFLESIRRILGSNVQRMTRLVQIKEELEEQETGFTRHAVAQTTEGNGESQFAKERSTDPSTSNVSRWSGIWGGKRRGSSSMTPSSDFKSKPRELYKDPEAIFCIEVRVSEGLIVLESRMKRALAMLMRS
ncbi:hypothetical protein AKJ16_DCAP15309 [Drosera capensis]